MSHPCSPIAFLIELTPWPLAVLLGFGPPHGTAETKKSLTYFQLIKPVQNGKWLLAGERGMNEKQKQYNKKGGQPRWECMAGRATVSRKNTFAHAYLSEWLELLLENGECCSIWSASRQLPGNIFVLVAWHEKKLTFRYTSGCGCTWLHQGKQFLLSNNRHTAPAALLVHWWLSLVQLCSTQKHSTHQSPNPARKSRSKSHRSDGERHTNTHTSQQAAGTRRNGPLSSQPKHLTSFSAFLSSGFALP